MGNSSEISSDPIERYKRIVIFLVMTIMIFGIVMVYSSSYIYAKEVYGSSFYYFMKQVTFALFGVAVAYVISKTKRTVWEKYAMEINMFMTFVLFLTLVPHIGIPSRGPIDGSNFSASSFNPENLPRSP